MKSDARVRYTKKAIREVFITLLEQKPISRITVTEICAAAQINRATFYKYYQDVYDLQEKIEDEISEEFRKSMEDLDKKGLHDTMVMILTRFQENYQEYSAIFGGNEYSGSALKIARTCYSMFSSKIPYPDFVQQSLSSRKMFYSYISAGSTGIISYWCYNHMKETPEEVATMMENMVHATLKGIR